MSCVFCDIVARRAPASFVHEDEVVAAFMTLQPTAGECLIIPKVHVDHLTDLPDDVAQQIIVVAQHLGRRMRRVFTLERVGYLVHGYGVPTRSSSWSPDRGRITACINWRATTITMAHASIGSCPDSSPSSDSRPIQPRRRSEPRITQSVEFAVEPLPSASCASMSERMRCAARARSSFPRRPAPPSFVQIGHGPRRGAMAFDTAATLF